MGEECEVEGWFGKKGSDCVWRGYAVIGMKMR